MYHFEIVFSISDDRDWVTMSEWRVLWKIGQVAPVGGPLANTYQFTVELGSEAALNPEMTPREIAVDMLKTVISRKVAILQIDCRKTVVS